MHELVDFLVVYDPNNVHCDQESLPVISGDSAFEETCSNLNQNLIKNDNFNQENIGNCIIKEIYNTDHTLLDEFTDQDKLNNNYMNAANLEVAFDDISFELTKILCKLLSQPVESS